MTETTNETQIIEHLVKNFGLNKSQAEEIFNSIIKNAFEDGYDMGYRYALERLVTTCDCDMEKNMWSRDDS